MLSGPLLINSPENIKIIEPEMWKSVALPIFLVIFFVAIFSSLLYLILKWRSRTRGIQHRPVLPRPPPPGDGGGPDDDVPTIYDNESLLDEQQPNWI